MDIGDTPIKNDKAISENGEATEGEQDSLPHDPPNIQLSPKVRKHNTEVSVETTNATIPKIRISQDMDQAKDIS